jgi:hypothetical protein
VIPSLSAWLSALPDPAIAEASASVATLTAHSFFNSSAALGVPVARTDACAGGSEARLDSTSADTNANGRITLPAARTALAKPLSAAGSDPPNKTSNNTSGDCLATRSAAVRSTHDGSRASDPPDR